VGWASFPGEVPCNRSAQAHQGKKILVVTGERGEESPARAKYKDAEPHRTDSKRRVVHQWASVKSIAESRFRRIAQLERDYSTTISKGRSVEDMARRGQEFVSDKPEELRRLAMSPDAFTAEMFFLPEGEVWKAPAGAYKRCGGPS
jgi:hypothetical protein